MPEHESFETDLLNEKLLVRFTKPSLVFPDQVASIHRMLPTVEAATLRLVVLDCTEVQHISSSCWAEMIRLNGILKSDGRQLRLCNLNAVSKEAFDVMKFGDVLDLRASTDEALDLE